MKQENKSSEVKPKAIFIAMAFIFILLQIGFHPTYLQYFPEFKKFNWLHHTHGAIMVSWMVMLVVQPYLIHIGKYNLHRLIGKISYVVAPLVIISMFMVMRMSYLNTVNKIDFKEVAELQALTIIELISFALFYILAVINKKDSAKHKRYMIGTAFIMIMAIFSRLVSNTFGTTKELYEFFIPLYLSAALSALLLVNDILKKNNIIPYTVVTVTIIFNTINFHVRYTEVWLSIVRFIGDVFY